MCRQVKGRQGCLHLGGEGEKRQYFTLVTFKLNESPQLEREEGKVRDWWHLRDKHVLKQVFFLFLCNAISIDGHLSLVSPVG